MSLYGANKYEVGPGPEKGSSFDRRTSARLVLKLWETIRHSPGMFSQPKSGKLVLSEEGNDSYFKKSGTTWRVK